MGGASTLLLSLQFTLPNSSYCDLDKLLQLSLLLLLTLLVLASVSSTEAESNITVNVHDYSFTFMVNAFTFTVYTHSRLFLCINTAKEACLSIAGSKDVSVAMYTVTLVAQLSLIVMLCTVALLKATHD